MEYPFHELTYGDLAIAANAIAQRMPAQPEFPHMNIAYAMTHLKVLKAHNESLAKSVIKGEMQSRWLATRMPNGVGLALDKIMNILIANLQRAFSMHAMNITRMHNHEDGAREHLMMAWEQLSSDIPAVVRRDHTVRQYAESCPYADEIVAARITLALHSTRAITLNVMCNHIS